MLMITKLFEFAGPGGERGQPADAEGRPDNSEELIRGGRRETPAEEPPVFGRMLLVGAADEAPASLVEVLERVDAAVEQVDSLARAVEVVDGNDAVAPTPAVAIRVGEAGGTETLEAMLEADEHVCVVSWRADGVDVGASGDEESSRVLAVDAGREIEEVSRRLEGLVERVVLRRRVERLRGELSDARETSRRLARRLRTAIEGNRRGAERESDAALPEPAQGDGAAPSATPHCRGQHRETAQHQARRDGVSDGLGRGEFELHYQPIVDLGEDEPTGFEALIRWDHSDRGILRAGEFIPAAEKSGVIREIDQWVLGRACSQVDQWSAKGAGAAPFVAVNISRVNLADPQFGARAAEAIRASVCEVDELRIEITETAMDRDGEVVRSNVERIAETGVPIWLDDFGVGAASMQALQRLPVSGIKIDREFLARGRDAAGAGVFEALVEMGRILDLELVAEGIETESELERARAAGCEWGQGYLFSKSVAACEVPTLRNRCGGVSDEDD